MVLLPLTLALALSSACTAPALSASWYGPGFHGRLTASGEVFNSGALTVAHRVLPFGTKLTLAYREKQIEVTVNDRGPFVGTRQLDLSEAAAIRLGIHDKGVAVLNVVACRLPRDQTPTAID